LFGEIRTIWSEIKINTPERAKAIKYYGIGLFSFFIITVIIGLLYRFLNDPAGKPFSFWESLYASCVCTLLFAASVGIAGFAVSIQKSSDLPMRARIALLLNAKSIDSGYVEEVEKQITDLVIISDYTNLLLKFSEMSPDSKAVKMNVCLERELVNLTNDTINELIIPSKITPDRYTNAANGILGTVFHIHTTIQGNKVERIQGPINIKLNDVFYDASFSVTLEPKQRMYLYVEYWTYFLKGENYSIQRKHYTRSHRVEVLNLVDKELTLKKVNDEDVKLQSKNPLKDAEKKCISQRSLGHKEKLDLFTLDWD
jgi:hypothetical protein